MSIGEKIREARKMAGLTQKELGEKLGVSAQMIASYEASKRNPKLSTLRRIAAAINIPVTDIIEPFNEDDYLTTYLIDMLEPLRNEVAHYDDNEINTIAAHHDGEDWTDEELEEIENFKKYVLSKRKTNNKE